MEVVFPPSHEMHFIYFFVGLDISLREQTKDNVNNKVKLTTRQNSGVINSLNYAVREQYGLQTPNQDLCR